MWVADGAGAGGGLGKEKGKLKHALPVAISDVQMLESGLGINLS
jgi:hypothetical protein